MAKRKPTLDSVMADFASLSIQDKRRFMEPYETKFLERLIRERQEIRAKIPRKRGNPDRDELILRKAVTMSDGEITKDAEVLAAHHRKTKRKLTTAAVQKVRRVHGMTKN